MTVTAVLFDLDGVLIDSGEAWYQVVAGARIRWGYDPIDREVFRARFGQGVEADQRLFFSRHTAEEIYAYYNEAFARAIGAIVLVDGARDVLDELGRRGIKRAVVTNTPVELARRILAEKGLGGRLEASAAAGEAAEKPAPDLVRLALSRVGADANAALYVGDSQSDRLATLAAGVRMIGLGIDADIRIESLRQVLDHLR